MKKMNYMKIRRFDMPKIVIIGAGSQHFAKDFITDVLMYPELRDSTIALVDIDKERLELMTAFTKKIVKQHGFNTKIESTTNRLEVLEGADYVVNAIETGWNQARIDREITNKHGIPWDDTIGPAGVFKGLRQTQVILDICHDMEKLCPSSWFMNFSNPQAINCWSINDYTRIKSVGLCPNQHGGVERIVKDAGISFDEVSYWLAGINHFSWYLEFKWRGEDYYPILREKFKGDVFSWPNAGWDRRDANGNRVGVDLVEVEMFKTFGYFTNGSSGHIPLYVPYFMKRPELIEKYNLGTVGIFSAGTKRMKDQDEEFKRQVKSDYKFPITNDFRWSIFAANIVHSIKTGIPRRINCNVKNKGIITNLLEGCCVEVPCLVDKEGIHPCYVGDLPPQCAALIRPSINVQELAVRGIAEKDKTKILQAILVDPLTSAVLTIDEIRLMVEELFQANKEYVQGFK